ncbi:lipoprotein [Spiroplasma culicicola]|uniref:Lipoprotein n=1 Tax=Spiroplasma culicicola AES-1 TaxID=1276246 RepID=W6A843_9MOLU|nr:lipoprotein [Spiroplasma culicicola]AHI53151.1 hypothetical protein SCULI_v1c08110 [Spiroplasma culicicola AES-1]
MKKLITLLGSLSLTASASTMAVACGTDYDQKKDGNSILIKFLNSLNGTAEIDASDVLWQLINTDGPANRSQFLLEMLQLFNVSLLANSETNFAGEDNILDEDNEYVNKELGNNLINKFKALNTAVDLQIQREKDDYKRTNGKKWEKKWKQMLVDKYSVYQEDTDDMDYAFLEAKYKADILMTDSTNNATKAILDVLLNTDSYGVVWTKKEDVRKKYTNLNNVKSDNTKLIQAYNADKLALDQIINSTTDEVDSWDKKYNNIDTSAENVEQAAKEIKDALATITKLEDIANDVPEDITQWSTLGSESRAGMLSKSQLFFLNKYFQTNAPLAISEIVVSFSDNGKFDDGISIEDFKGDQSIDAKALIKLYNTISSDTSGWWTTALIDSSLATGLAPKATVKKYDNLLTLSSSSETFSDTLKTVVYDHVLGTETGNSIELAKDLNDETALETVITNLNRAATNTTAFYGTLGENKLVYIDTDGMHFVSLDGYSKFNTTRSETDETTTDSDTLKQLKLFNEFHSLTDRQKVIKLMTDSSSTYMTDLNSSINNEYLQYLVNTSLLKGISSSPVNYDIMSEVKSWATVSSSTESQTYWTTTVFDYFKTTTNLTKNNELLSQFIIFGEGEEAHNPNGEEIAIAMQGWTVNAIGSSQENTEDNPSILFVENHKNWKETIEKNTTLNYPIKTMTNTKFNADTLSGTISEKWNPNSTLIKYDLRNSMSYTSYLFNTLGGEL